MWGKGKGGAERLGDLVYEAGFVAGLYVGEV